MASKTGVKLSKDIRNHYSLLRNFNSSLHQSFQTSTETPTTSSTTITTAISTTNIQSQSSTTTGRTSIASTEGSWNTNKTTTTQDPWRDRCKEMRRRVSHGLEDYARRSGDAELMALVQPIFTRKKLVVWSVDHHIGPMSDMRSLFEPFGVEFLEHTLYGNCALMCTCDQQSKLKVLNGQNVFHVLGAETIERFMSESKSDFDFNRADAYLSSWSSNMLELYMRYNKSIIFHSPIRFDGPIDGHPDHFRTLVSLFQKAATNEANIIAANNHYDEHYIKYFTGVNIDFVPSFCVYTGETYNPILKSYLLWERRLGFNHGLGDYWTEHFDGHIRRTGARIELRDVRSVYRGHEYRDVARHLGITHIPYHPTLMSFIEHYRMDIPLFCPSKEFLSFLHYRFYTMYDRTRNGGSSPTARGSIFPPHPSMAGTPDPKNDFDLTSINYWIPLSDFYYFPHITYFDSFEQLVDTLHNMTETRLLHISSTMRAWNRENLKVVLRYWRRRLLNIAFYRMSNN